MGGGVMRGVLALAAFSLAAASCSAPMTKDGAFRMETGAGQRIGCELLAGLDLPDVEIVTAAAMPAGADVPHVGLMTMFGTPASQPVARGLPAFCRVAGYIRPEPGSEIGFELWLPADGWDGRLYGVGIGGFAGAIDYYTLGAAVKAGQAGVATDTGHKGSGTQSAWAKGHPAKVRDYASRGIHLSTVTAKQLVAAHYGRRPEHSYFVGCSGGGRQGLMEAALYPEDYDGIVSGAPAASVTELMLAMVNALQAQQPEGSKIRPEQVKLLQDEVLGQCDAGDGQSDGLVADPRQCRFDASRLACGASKSEQCFGAPQVAALERILAGPRNSAGKRLAAAYLPSGSEAGNPFPPLGWEGYLVSAKGAPSGAQLLADGFLGDLIQQPFSTPEDFDFDTDPARLLAAAREMDAPLDLGRFFARGGKLIFWHGWADAAIPPEATLRYHREMLRASGPKAEASTRLFMVPGVQHCFGGLGPDSFGHSSAPQQGDTPQRSLVAALQAWVEGERAAPDTLVGRRGHGGFMGMPVPNPERQRLLCAWPKQAVLNAGGDPDKAADYVCN